MATMSSFMLRSRAGSDVGDGDGDGAFGACSFRSSLDIDEGDDDDDSFSLSLLLCFVDRIRSVFACVRTLITCTGRLSHAVDLGR